MKRRKATLSCKKKQLTLGRYFGQSACENRNDLINRKTLQKKESVSKELEWGANTHVVRKSLSLHSKSKDCSASGNVSFRLRKTGSAGSHFSSVKRSSLQWSEAHEKQFHVVQNVDNHAGRKSDSFEEKPADHVQRKPYSLEEKSAELVEKTGASLVRDVRAKKSIGLQQHINKDCDTPEEKFLAPGKIDSATTMKGKSIIRMSENHRGCVKKSLRLSLRKRKKCVMSPDSKNSHKSSVKDSENYMPEDNTSEYKLALTDVENFMDAPQDSLSVTSGVEPLIGSVFFPELLSPINHENKSPVRSNNHSMLLFSSPLSSHKSHHEGISTSKLFSCDVSGKSNSNVTRSECFLFKECGDISWSEFMTDLSVTNGTKFNRYLIIEVVPQNIEKKLVNINFVIV